MTNVDDIVAAKIAAAIARTVATKRRRATQQAARQAGLTARHRTKLARLDAAEASSVGAADGTLRASERPEASPVLEVGLNNPDALSTTEPTEPSAPAVATPALISRLRALHREEFGVCLECSGEASVPWPCPTFDVLLDWLMETIRASLTDPTEGTTS